MSAKNSNPDAMAFKPMTLAQALNKKSGSSGSKDVKVQQLTDMLAGGKKSAKTMSVDDTNDVKTDIAFGGSGGKKASSKRSKD